MPSRIMNKVMTIAEDFGVFVLIYYQDTELDSDIHVPTLSTNFKHKFNCDLIGKQFGQFYSDFSLGNCQNVVTIESIGLGKKSYIDKLEGINQNRDIATGYHIRMKGIPTDSVTSKAEQMNIIPFKLYEKLYNSEEVKIDKKKFSVWPWLQVVTSSVPRRNSAMVSYA